MGNNASVVDNLRFIDATLSAVGIHKVHRAQALGSKERSPHTEHIRSVENFNFSVFLSACRYT